jgi:DNA replication and repair protein RecF
MIRRFKVSNFRCLENAELELSPGFNLIYGANASGKTSLLEALAYLGRGKSFRGASTSNLIRHGQSEFVLFGERRQQVVRSGLAFGTARTGWRLESTVAVMGG